MAVLASPAVEAEAAKKKREVVVVGNNWAGTADVLLPGRGYRRVARLNIIPDGGVSRLRLIGRVAP